MLRVLEEVSGLTRRWYRDAAEMLTAKLPIILFLLASSCMYQQQALALDRERSAEAVMADWAAWQREMQSVLTVSPSSFGV